MYSWNHRHWLHSLTNRLPTRWPSTTPAAITDTRTGGHMKRVNHRRNAFSLTSTECRAIIGWFRYSWCSVTSMSFVCGARQEPTINFLIQTHKRETAIKKANDSNLLGYFRAIVHNYMFGERPGLPVPVNTEEWRQRRKADGNRDRLRLRGTDSRRKTQCYFIIWLIICIGLN